MNKITDTEKTIAYHSLKIMCFGGTLTKAV